MTDNKLFLKVLYTSSTSTFIHSARRQKIYNFDFSKINLNGYNILNEKIEQNLFFNKKDKRWDEFGQLNKENKNIYEILKNDFNNNFEKIGLNKKDFKKNKLLTQYIISISPDFFEKTNLLKYNEFLINENIKKWGIDNIIDKNKIIDVFDNINNSLREINTFDTKYNNFVGSIIHLDEKTPHMHSFFSNIDLNDNIKITRKNNSSYIDLRIKIEKEINKIYWIKNNDLFKIKIDEKEKTHQKWKDDFVKDFKKMEKKYNLEELKKLAVDFNENKYKLENTNQNNLLEHIEIKNKEHNKDEINFERENNLSSKDINIDEIKKIKDDLDKKEYQSENIDQKNLLKYTKNEEEKLNYKDENNLKNILNTLEQLKKDGYNEIKINSNVEKNLNDDIFENKNDLDEKENNPNEIENDLDEKEIDLD